MPADEAPFLVPLHREPQTRPVRGVPPRHVASPDPVSLFEPQGVDRLVAAGDETVRSPRLPEGVPERYSELGGAVELPAELADVRDPQRVARDRPDREVPRPQVRESLVREI